MYLSTLLDNDILFVDYGGSQNVFQIISKSLVVYAKLLHKSLIWPYINELMKLFVGEFCNAKANDFYEDIKEVYMLGYI